MLTQTASTAVQAVGAAKGGVKSCPHDESGPEFVCVCKFEHVSKCVYMYVCVTVDVSICSSVLWRVSCACRGYSGVHRYVIFLAKSWQSPLQRVKALTESVPLHVGTNGRAPPAAQRGGVRREIVRKGK